LENTLEWTIDFKPTIVLVNDSEKFQEMTGNSLIVAYAVSQRNLIVIDHSKMNTKPFSLGSIIKHELCHLLLHDKISKVILPRWLDEGVSQWVSDGIAEIIMSRRVWWSLSIKRLAGRDSLTCSNIWRMAMKWMWRF
jgi:hypothetical protein